MLHFIIQSMSGVAKYQVTRKGYMSVCPLMHLGPSLVKGTHCSKASDFTLKAGYEPAYSDYL